MKNHFAVSPLSTVLKAMAFGACAMTLPLSAHALVVTTTDVVFDESQSVTDLQGQGSHAGRPCFRQQHCPVRSLSGCADRRHAQHELVAPLVGSDDRDGRRW